MPTDIDLLPARVHMRARPEVTLVRPCLGLTLYLEPVVGWAEEWASDLFGIFLEHVPLDQLKAWTTSRSPRWRTVSDAEELRVQLQSGSLLGKVRHLLRFSVVDDTHAPGGRPGPGGDGVARRRASARHELAQPPRHDGRRDGVGPGRARRARVAPRHRRAAPEARGAAPRRRAAAQAEAASRPGSVDLNDGHACTSHPGELPEGGRIRVLLTEMGFGGMQQKCKDDISKNEAAAGGATPPTQQELQAAEADLASARGRLGASARKVNEGTMTQAEYDAQRAAYDEQRARVDGMRGGSNEAACRAAQGRALRDGTTPPPPADRGPRQPGNAGANVPGTPASEQSEDGDGDI